MATMNIIWVKRAQDNSSIKRTMTLQGKTLHYSGAVITSQHIKHPYDSVYV